MTNDLNIPHLDKNQGRVEIIITEDGSHSLFSPELNETYHSVHGAVQESTHVFIKKGLDYLLERSNPVDIHILEIGFGTGLNTLLTLHQALHFENKIHYTTLDTFPLEADVWSKLNYTDSSKGLKNYFEDIHASPWEKWTSIITNFNLLKLNAKLELINLEQSHYNLIFFDAFAPSKQPGMWEFQILKKISESLKPGGVFVTYCAKGQLKRDLKNLGLEVETLPGPPGKKEMVRATKFQDMEPRT